MRVFDHKTDSYCILVEWMRVFHRNVAVNLAGCLVLYETSIIQMLDNGGVT